MKCKKCGSPKTRWYGSQRKITYTCKYLTYHRCLLCGHRFTVRRSAAPTISPIPDASIVADEHSAVISYRKLKLYSLSFSNPPRALYSIRLILIGDSIPLDTKLLYLGVDNTPGYRRLNNSYPLQFAPLLSLATTLVNDGHLAQI